MKRAATPCLLAVIAIFHCANPAQSATPSPSAPKETLPAGVLRKGSLANEKLITDASVAAVGKLATMGHTVDPHKVTFQPYVVAMPKGRPGSRAWTERWYFTVKGKQVPVTIEFSEDGLGAANYTIRK